MVVDYDNFVFLVHQVTLLDKEARRVYFSCGNSIQLNDQEFKKVLAQVKAKYALPEVVSDSIQKPKTVNNKKQK